MPIPIPMPRTSPLPKRPSPTRPTRTSTNTPSTCSAGSATLLSSYPATTTGPTVTARPSRTATTEAAVVVTRAEVGNRRATVPLRADPRPGRARQSIAFDGRVVLVNGDSHSFEMDNPLTDAATTNAAGLAGPNVIENFTRVTTFGDVQNHWVSATIDAKDPNVFTFHPHLVTGNLPTYTPPPVP